MRLLRWLPMALVLAGCAEGPQGDTLLYDTRVVALVADPPEVSPGDEVRFDVFVSDPDQAGVELLLWQCTSLGEGCLEEGGEHSFTPTLDQGQASVTTTVSSALAALASEEPLRATLVWALACQPGLCPQISDPSGSDLSDPISWLRELPFEGVNLAFTTLALSTRAEGLVNPGLSPDFSEVISVGEGESVELPFTVDLAVPATADTLAYGFATAGGFDATEYTVGDDGEVTLVWYAPEEPGSAELYVVLNDGQGGVAVWTGSATTQ